VATVELGASAMMRRPEQLSGWLAHDRRRQNPHPELQHSALVGERDRLIPERGQTIRDLWARLDGQVEERRRLLALLTDQRARPWWRRWWR